MPWRLEASHTPSLNKPQSQCCGWCASRTPSEDARAPRASSGSLSLFRCEGDLNRAVLQLFGDLPAPRAARRRAAAQEATGTAGSNPRRAARLEATDAFDGHFAVRWQVRQTLKEPLRGGQVRARVGNTCGCSGASQHLERRVRNSRGEPIHHHRAFHCQPPTLRVPICVARHGALSAAAGTSATKLPAAKAHAPVLGGSFLSLSASATKGA